MTPPDLPRDDERDGVGGGCYAVLVACVGLGALAGWALYTLLVR